MRKAILLSLVSLVLTPFAARTVLSKESISGQGGNNDPAPVHCSIFSECDGCNAVQEGVASVDWSKMTNSFLPLCERDCPNKCKPPEKKLLCTSRHQWPNYCAEFKTKKADLSRVNKNPQWKAFVKALESEGVKPSSCLRTQACQQCMVDTVNANGQFGRFASASVSQHVVGIACDFFGGDLAKVRGMLHLLKGTPHRVFTRPNGLGPVTVMSIPGSYKAE